MIRSRRLNVVVLMMFGGNNHDRFECRIGASAQWWGLFACLMLFAGGCGSGATTGNGAPDDSRIKPLTTLFTSYMNRNGGRPPANEAEFKKYVAERGAALLDSIGVSQDELFISPRDNEPHVVLYGNEAVKLLSRGVVVYERTGVGGRRLVGYRAGYVNEIDDAEFQKLNLAP
jgi:hypothetical protein